MRISDWSSDVCSSDLDDEVGYQLVVTHDLALLVLDVLGDDAFAAEERPFDEAVELLALVGGGMNGFAHFDVVDVAQQEQRAHRLAQFAKCPVRSEEHTSELQSLMRISYAVFCLKKKTQTTLHNNYHTSTH